PTLPAPTQIYTLSLHDALPICSVMRHVAPRMENEVDVEEVGVRRPRREQVAAAREVVIGVVVVEPSTRVRSPAFERPAVDDRAGDRKSTRLNSSHGSISYAVFC